MVQPEFTPRLSQCGPAYYIQAHASRANDNHILDWLNPGSEESRAHSGRHRATQQGRQFQGHIGANGNRALRRNHHGGTERPGL